MDMDLSKLWLIVEDRGTWCAAVLGSQRVGHNLVTEQHIFLVNLNPTRLLTVPQTGLALQTSLPLPVLFPLPIMLFQAVLSGDCQVGKSVDLESHKTACDLRLDPGSAAYQPCSLEQIL